MNQWMADPQFVKTHYRTPEHLAVQIQIHNRYTVPPLDLPRAVVEQIPWRGDEWVLDVGCGSGAYLRPVQKRTPYYIAGDLSTGMLAALPTRQRLNLDAQALPLATHRLDCILANHMLYHVPDQPAALRAFGRALKPGGYLLAATNGRHNMAALRQLMREVAATEGGLASSRSDNVGDDVMDPTERFNLENGGAILAPFFQQVQRVDFPSAFVFPEARPAVAYVNSIAQGMQRQLNIPPERWDAFLERFQSRVEAIIAQAGVWHVPKVTGVFVCQTATEVMGW